jgi:hypothetical protein
MFKGIAASRCALRNAAGAAAHVRVSPVPLCVPMLRGDAIPLLGLSLWRYSEIYNKNIGGTSDAGNSRMMFYLSSFGYNIAMTSAVWRSEHLGSAQTPKAHSA